MLQAYQEQIFLKSKSYATFIEYMFFTLNSKDLYMVMEIHNQYMRQNFTIAFFLNKQLPPIWKINTTIRGKFFL
jgi:hypothetical protein